MTGREKDKMSVAITGLACRFPGDGNNLNNFWQSICEGKSAWSEIPSSRFNAEAFWSPDKKRNKSVTRGAHFLKQDIALFDANFFGISSTEASSIDPQHRIMIEVAYEALETAGYPLAELIGTRTGVFMGHFTSDWKDTLYRDPDAAPPYSATGPLATSLANRISWLWDLRGPSFSIDTACSSSLVALHLATQSLCNGESDTAIVGGSSLLINPDMFSFLSGQNFLSPDGKCKTFDASGDGYGRGEGIAVIVLKRVDDAIVLCDPIRAVIRGTGSNQDGHTKGFTLPSADAQAQLIDQVYKHAGLDFADTMYVEAHGTGTQAGDVEETTALYRTISGAHSPNNKLTVGSVKSNMGHTEAAAGLAGVIKSILMLENGMIPPNIHFKNPNPKIKFNEWNIKIPIQLSSWPVNGLRRISVNSFGYGGTNAHAILDDAHSYLQSRGMTAPHFTKTGSTPKTNGIDEHYNRAKSTLRLILVSAQDRKGLGRVKRSLASFVHQKTLELHTTAEQDAYFADLAYTIGAKRSRLQWKTFTIASSLDDLRSALEADDNTSPEHLVSRSPRLGFVFTGQGAHWAGMGTELMSYATYRDSVKAADAYLRTQLDCEWSAVEELARGKATSRLGVATYSQTLSTVLQVALVDLLREWGVEPAAVIGHSSGEIGAAYCMGALSREGAWKIAYYRGTLSSSLKTIAPDIEGAMMAVGASPQATTTLINRVCPGGGVEIACINSPSSVTVSGDAADINRLLATLTDEGVFARKLLVDTAYHSQHMQLVAQDYFAAIADIEILGSSSRGCVMHSSVTGSVMSPDELGAAHWVRNLISPVQFAPAVQDMIRPIVDGKRSQENAIDVLVEIGPHSALQGPSTQSLKAIGINNLPYLSAIIRNQNGIHSILSLAGSLLVQGLPINLAKLNTQDGSTRNPQLLVDLPLYPWNHAQRYWTESRVAREYRLREVPSKSLIGAPTATLAANEREWRGFIRVSEEPWVADHKIQGSILYPAAGFLAMAIEAALQIADEARKVVGFRLREIQLVAALVVTEGADIEYTVRLRPHLTGTRETTATWMEFTVSSSPDGIGLTQNCLGLILVEYSVEERREMIREMQLKDEAIVARYHEATAECKFSRRTQDFYQELHNLGLEYGPAFRNVTEIRTRKGQSWGVVAIPNVGFGTSERKDRPHVIHPGTLDAVFHLVFAALNSNQLSAPMVPRFIEGLFVAANVPYAAHTRLKGFSTAKKHGFKELQADILMLDETETSPLISISGFTCAEVAGSSLLDSDSALKKLCSKLVWRPAINILNKEEIHNVIMAAAYKKGVQSVFAHTQLEEYIKLLHHINPGLSILEFAAGTKSLLASLDITDVLSTAEYGIACPNDVMKAALQQTLAEFQMASYYVLPLAQDVAEKRKDSVDLVFASDITSAEAIENIKLFLKPDGKVCLLEETQNVEAGEKLLRDAGFTDIAKLDSPAAIQPRLILATARGVYTNGIGNSHHSDPVEVVLVRTSNASKAVLKTVTQLATCLANLGYKTTTLVWGGDNLVTRHGETRIFLSLLELEKPLLENLSEADFEATKKMILDARSVFWVVGSDGPASAMINGLARVLRSEVAGISLRTMNTSSLSLQLPETQTRLAELLAWTFNSKSDDNEFLVKDGIVQVSRITEDKALNNEMDHLDPQNSKMVDTITLKDTSRPVKLAVGQVGLMDSLYFEQDRVPLTELKEDEIEIQVKATALNFREVMVVMGQIPDSLLGFDAAGVVLRVGSSVTMFRVGDSVAMCGHGSHRTIHRAKAGYCALIPEGLSFEQAATIPVVHATAWYGLVYLARVRSGQTILIHAAAGGVGQAAIQLAKHFGLEVFATVGSEAKRKLLRDTYGLTEDHIFNSRDLSFADGVRRMTNGRGVDVVLNSLAGEALHQTWHCIAPFGYFIEIGLKDILANTRLDMRPFLQDATFSFFNLNHIEREQPTLMAEIIQGAFDFLQRGITYPVMPLVTYSISDVEAAFRLMQTGKHIGKIALSFNDDAVIPVARSGVESLFLDLDPVASYVLVGGLGGLGRSLAGMLVDNGARKICFLSRSGARNVAAQALIRDLQTRDVQVLAPKCDVTDAISLQTALEQCAQKLGPVRGVIQCAMVLRDTLFANMTYTQWIESTRPKVQGTWNLHMALPNVSFFVVLSSFAGIFGNRGQSNYAAACAFQDEIAHLRRRQGKRAVTLDIGLMRDIGVLAESGITDSLRDWEIPYGIREHEFLNLLKVAIAGDTAGTVDPQILTGMATGGSALAFSIPEPFYLSDARFAIMAKTGLREHVRLQQLDDVNSVQTLVAGSASVAEAAEHVLAALVNRVAKMLQTPSSEIDTRRPLHSYGIDSLVAIEIVNWALKELKAQLTVFDVMAAVPTTITATKIAAGSALLPEMAKNS